MLWLFALIPLVAGGFIIDSWSDNDDEVEDAETPDVTVTDGDGNGPVTINGSSDADEVNEQNSKKDIVATLRSGDDNAITGAGDDEIYGGAGNDALLAGAGNDLLSGGKGNDILVGGEGEDQLFGHEGADALWGGGFSSDDEVLIDDLAADTLSGGWGADILIGGASDVLTGGEKADTFYAIQNSAEEGNAPVVTDFESGLDTLGVIVEDDDPSPDHVSFQENADGTGVDMFYRSVKVMTLEGRAVEDFANVVVDVVVVNAQNAA
ncbi:Hemolysin-type calcium-binding repeat-containing protein [Aliiroseovarius crassostreae]|uniref:Type I secretion protein n=1 Tax=Aliiroseovarius crassostreae TaxID=154981 RepID=A0A0N8IBA6_9RHOB|nr:calcium-binding protein [Aliiroseovarius crassostreae]KPN62571.1 hypothetical protein AKJ29_10245 [Aliiroseovarius crassostreae]SFU95187.1 Hemolysin-type calcium-binding repeat-containing protein [Aliiroseovarius crassostreae]